MTGFGTIESAVEAMKLGAVDFVQKPFFAEELLLRVKAATERRQLARQVRLLEQRASPDDPLASLVGESEVMVRVRDLVRRAAAMSGTVLITGETGTGKELVARAIHAESARAERPFVVFNCAAVSGQLIEQELFGHVRGAFPGRDGRPRGPHRARQPGHALLRRDQPARARIAGAPARRARIGHRTPHRRERRAARSTSGSWPPPTRDLRAAVETGAFRQDLYYRLNAYLVHLPPLRERPGDVETLVAHFIRKYSPFEPREIAEDAMQAMLRYHYPGNVRELEHIVQRALALAQGRPIQLADLPESVIGGAQPRTRTRPSASVAAARDRAERAMILGSLANHHGDLTEVAHELQVSRTTLWRLMRKHGIRVPD